MVCKKEGNRGLEIELSPQQVLRGRSQGCYMPGPVLSREL